MRNEERERYGTRMRCADEAWAPWALEHKLPCKGFDYMYVKYKMFEECDTLQEVGPDLPDGCPSR